MEPELEPFNVAVVNNVVPPCPLSAEINILAAHGGRNIAAFPYLSINDDVKLTDVENLVGNGRILVLFVCHSGSMRQELFRHRVASVVGGFLKRGYQAVIAPFWSLDISVPPVWLPAFLGRLIEGATVAEAHFGACAQVFENNAHPGAWSCLHLYGDPQVRLSGQ